MFQPTTTTECIDNLAIDTSLGRQFQSVEPCARNVKLLGCFSVLFQLYFRTSDGLNGSSKLK